MGSDLIGEDAGIDNAQVSGAINAGRIQMNMEVEEKENPNNILQARRNNTAKDAGQESSWTSLEWPQPMVRKKKNRVKTYSTVPHTQCEAAYDVSFK
jgi:hypothetical protein